MFEYAKFLTAKWGTLSLAAAALLAITGCQSPQYSDLKDSNTPNLTDLPVHSTHNETIILREGDQVRITFPAASGFNTTTPIRRDGNIVLQIVGEVKAAGKTPEQLKEDVLKAYAGQIDSKQASVELLNGDFPVFVSGAVLRPSKVMSNHPMTALEAIMEAGGFDYTRANLRSVRVLRPEGTHLKIYNLDLKSVMNGKDVEQFYMKAGDIIYVKEKFTWF